MLRDMDRGFVIGFAARSWLMQDVTGPRTGLEAGLEIVRGVLWDKVAGNGSVLYEAVTGLSDQVMKGLQGRKALVLLTDGDDTVSHARLDLTIASCQRSDTTVYSIGIGIELAKGILETLARKTGGAYFAVSKKQKVEAIYQAIEAELRNQYNIGYIPPPSALGKNRDGFHKVRVTVKRSGLTVRTRDGYYSEE
jgi:Ca-activated chloride channel family protein